MGVPASAIRRLIGRAAKTALAEGMAVKGAVAKGDVMKGPLVSALMRQAVLSEKTQRGDNQLNRLKALLEGMYKNALHEGSLIPDTDHLGRPLTEKAHSVFMNNNEKIRGIGKLLSSLKKTDEAVGDTWRGLMEGSR